MYVQRLLHNSHSSFVYNDINLTVQQHPDLFILFFGWFEDPDRDAIHIAMEFIEHGDLGHYMAENPGNVEAKEITSQILEGLVVLHEREICHRDLKPQVSQEPTLHRAFH